MILLRVGNQETTINKKFRAIEQIFVLDPVNEEIVQNVILYLPKRKTSYFGKIFDSVKG